MAGWLRGGLAVYMAGGSVATYLFIWLAGSMTGCLSVWLAQWLSGCSSGWLVASMAGCLFIYLAGSVTGCLAAGLCGWLRKENASLSQATGKMEKLGLKRPITTMAMPITRKPLRLCLCLSVCLSSSSFLSQPILWNCLRMYTKFALEELSEVGCSIKRHTEGYTCFE